MRMRYALALAAAMTIAGVIASPSRADSRTPGESASSEAAGRRAAAGPTPGGAQLAEPDQGMSAATSRSRSAAGSAVSPRWTGPGCTTVERGAVSQRNLWPGEV